MKRIRKVQGLTKASRFNNAHNKGVFIDKPTRPHIFVNNRAGQCTLCIFPQTHIIHLIK